jgi:hypothetical protein
MNLKYNIKAYYKHRHTYFTTKYIYKNDLDPWLLIYTYAGLEFKVRIDGKFD